MTDYSPAQVTKALMQLVANGGNLKKTADELIDDEFQVPESTLRYWRDEAHREQYRRLEDEYGRQLEQEAISAARLLIFEAQSAERELVQKIHGRLPQMDPREMPQALRALTDAKAKAVDRVLSMTGRPVHGQVATTSDIVTLVEQMAAKGLVRLAAGVELVPPKGELPKG